MPSLPKTYKAEEPKLSNKKIKLRQQAKARAKRRLYATNHPKWRRIRAEQLRQEPLCRHCKQDHKYTPANEVDHIDGDTYNNSPENLQSLCKPCHSRKTAREQGMGK